MLDQENELENASPDTKINPQPARVPVTTERKPSKPAMRLGFLVLLLFVWILLLIVITQLPAGSAALLYCVLIAASEATILALTAKSREYRLAWALLMLIIPVLGFIPFFMWGHVGGAHNARHARANAKARSCLIDDLANSVHAAAASPETLRPVRTLAASGFPAYHADAVRYTGAALYEAVLNTLRNAEKYIFIEQASLSSGPAWERVKALLIEKAALGVEIKLLCDGLGLSRLGKNTAREFAAHGIKLRVFNASKLRLAPFLARSADVRSLAVADGNAAIIGGFCISTACVNDEGLCVTGRAAYSAAAYFLAAWEAESGEEPVFDHCVRFDDTPKDAAGLVLPFVTRPQSGEARGLYIHILNVAKNYAYISTPSPILDAKVAEALRDAALAGVETRLVVGPGTSAYEYAAGAFGFTDLMKAGVKVYQKKPASQTAFTLASDDSFAVIGSCGPTPGCMDFSNAVMLCNEHICTELRRDFDAIFWDCVELNPAVWTKRPAVKKAGQALCKVFGCFLFD